MERASSASQVQGPTNPAELEAFLDEVMAKDMEEHHITGATVSFVKDGKLFFTKSYDYADLKKKIPVDPEQTAFPLVLPTSWSPGRQKCSSPAGGTGPERGCQHLSRLSHPGYLSGTDYPQAPFDPCGVFGRWDFIANGVLFATYHLLRIWGMPSQLFMGSV